MIGTFLFAYDKKKQRLRVIYNGMCVYVVTYNGMFVYVVNYNGMFVYVVNYNGKNTKIKLLQYH